MKKSTIKQAKTSVALFDDCDIVCDTPGKPKKHTGKKSAGNSKTAKSKSAEVPANKRTRTANKKQSDNTVKQHPAKPVKQLNKKKQKDDSTVNNRKHRVTISSGAVGTADNTRKKSKKSEAPDRNNKNTGTNTVQKPKRSGSSVQDNSAADKTDKGFKQRAGKRVKADNAECKTSTVAKTKSAEPVVPSAKGNRKTKIPDKRINGRTREAEIQAKAVARLKRKYNRIDYVPPPCAITGNPVPIKDDPFLVRITVNGEPRDVSCWSIRNKTYYPGLDSEFLVHCLSYPSTNKKKH